MTFEDVLMLKVVGDPQLSPDGRWRKTTSLCSSFFFPREPHGLQEPRHQLDKMRREYEWMARYVLDRPIP